MGVVQTLVFLMQPAVTIVVVMSLMSQTAYIHMTFEPTWKGSIGIKMLIWDITIYPGINTIAQY